MKLKVNRSIGWNLEYATMNITQIIEDGSDCYPWTKKYAWLPVKTVSGKYVWRQHIYKRRVWVVWGTGFHMEPHVQYATLFEMLTYKDNVL